MAIKEEVPVGTVIGELQAIDEDIGDNAAIDYTITSGNEFGLVKLERTNGSKAVIIAAARLDRETISKVLLTVKCFKYGAKTRLSKTYNRLVRIITQQTQKNVIMFRVNRLKIFFVLQDPAEIQVLIKVLDIDDHLPEFESANMTIGVRLNVPIDTIIGNVKATDKDPEAKPIIYKIVNMTFESPIKGKSLSNITDVIVLNNATADLKIMKNLIHYADGIFR